MRKPRIWIFANGEIGRLDLLRIMVLEGDTLLAADGGSRHIRALGLKPDMVVGDFDSLDAGELQRFQEQGVVMKRFPPGKDETDLELALRLACSLDPSFIRIAGALGGRMDQTLGNLFLLSNPALAGIDIRLEDGSTEVVLLRAEGIIHGKPGDTVSLIPLGAPAKGILTTGLEFPLKGETLFPEQTRGISNRMIGSQASIRLDEGKLVCIHIRKLEVDHEII